MHLGMGMWDWGGGMWDLGLGRWDVGCGIWDVGFGSSSTRMSCAFTRDYRLAIEWALELANSSLSDTGFPS